MNYYIYFVKCGVYRKGNEDKPIFTFRCKVRLNGKESKKSATRNKIFTLIKKHLEEESKKSPTHNKIFTLIKKHLEEDKDTKIKVISFSCIGIRYLRTNIDGVALPDPNMGDNYVVFID